MPPVKMTRAEYEAKYGTKPVVPSSPAPVKMSRAEYNTKYGIDTPAVESDKGFLGNLAADILRPGARLATNLVNAWQIGWGEKQTDPFSGSFFGQVDRVGNTGKGFVADLKDATGVGLEVASNIPIAKGGKLTFDVFKSALKPGGMRALRAAAIPVIVEGAAGGGMVGAGQALQEDKGAEGVLLDTLKGSAIGAAAAPAVGTLASGAGRIFGRYTNAENVLAKGEDPLIKKATQKEIDDIADYVSPPVDANLKRGLRTEKRGTEYPGIFSKKRFELGDEDYAMAQATKDIVDPNRTANENIDSILKDVDRVHKQEMIPFLQENPSPYDFRDLNKYVNNKMKPSSMLRPNSDNAYAFNTIKNNGMKIISQFPPTTEGIQQARYAIDDMINREFGDAIWDKSGINPMATGAREAAMKLRTVLNDFTEDSLKFKNIEAVNKVDDFLKEAQKRGIKIDDMMQVKEALLKKFGAEILPENELKALVFRNKLRNMSLKLDAADNIWRKESKEVGKTRFQNIKNPLVKNAIGYGSAALAGGYLLPRIFGGGSNNNSN